MTSPIDETLSRLEAALATDRPYAASTAAEAVTALTSMREERDAAVKLNNKYAWERDKAREERDAAERKAEAFWKPRTETAERQLAEAREVVRPFVRAFELRRDFYSSRHSDRDLGYANFDKMPDDWPMEKVIFTMGHFRRARTFIKETKRG